MKISYLTVLLFFFSSFLVGRQMRPTRNRHSVPLNEVVLRRVLRVERNQRLSRFYRGVYARYTTRITNIFNDDGTPVDLRVNDLYDIASDLDALAEGVRTERLNRFYILFRRLQQSALGHAHFLCSLERTSNNQSQG